MSEEVDLTKVRLDEFNGYKIVYLDKDCPFANISGLFTSIGLPMKLGNQHSIAVYADIWDKLDINARKVVLVTVLTKMLLDKLKPPKVSVFEYPTIIHRVCSQILGYLSYTSGVRLTYNMLLDDLDWHDDAAYSAWLREIGTIDDALLNKSVNLDAAIKHILLQIPNKESFAGQSTQTVGYTVYYVGVDEPLMSKVRKLYEI